MKPDSADSGGERFLRGARGRASSREEPAAEVLPLPAPAEPAAQQPQRYLIREDGSGPFLTSRETPELKVRLDRSLSVTAATARKAAEGTIFLDGAAQGKPFLDLERRVFNLDHHEGVIRRFTLSACEQAMVLMLRGIDLRERPWTILANQPDLDTVLAIWVLLNSIHLGADQPEIRSAAIALVRVEGLIDSQGLELLEFSAMAEGDLRETMARLDELRAVELAAAVGEEATQEGPLELLQTLLGMLDRMIYPLDFFEPLPPMEELALVELSSHRIAVVCRCDCGIYEAEPVLKRLYGKRLGIVALQKSPEAYTLRQVDSFLPGHLDAVYRTLNLMDPAVRNSRSSNRWGGSGEIGGSPRSAGTRLTPGEIAAACSLAYRQPSPAERWTSAAVAVLASSLCVVAGWLAAALASGEAPWTGGARPQELVSFAGVTAVIAALLLAGFGASRRPGFYGLRLPAGWAWLWLAPVAVVGALLGGAWMPAVGGIASLAQPLRLAALALLPPAAELAFRGLAQGRLLERLQIREPSRPWLPSWPAMLSAAVYALWTVVLRLAGAVAGPPLVAAAAGALVLGLALGMARERAESLVASLALHYLAAAAAVLAAVLL